jgi:hypothetical protein
MNNDIENGTSFLILLLATVVFSDDVSGYTNNCLWYGLVAYFLVLQSWRTLAFFVDLLCTIAEIMTV